jgi:hypothetical protein
VAEEGGPSRALALVREIFFSPSLEILTLFKIIFLI